MVVEISNSGSTLLRLPILPVVLIILLLIVLIVLSIPTIRRLFQKKDSNQDCGKNCNYSQCSELTKKDLRHVVIFFSTVIIFILVFLLTGDQSAMEYFSFASTITSIVLSVVAIIMTISSESKSEGVKHQIDKSVEELGSAKQTIQEHITRMATQAEAQEKTFKDILSKSEEILEMTKSLDKRLESKRIPPKKVETDDSTFKAEVVEVDDSAFKEEDIPS